MMGAYFFAKRLFTYAFVCSGAIVNMPGSLAEHLWPWVDFFPFLLASDSPRLLNTGSVLTLY